MHNMVLLPEGGAVHRKLANLYYRCDVNVYCHKYHPPQFKRYHFVVKSWANKWRSRRMSTMTINTTCEPRLRLKIHLIMRMFRPPPIAKD